MKKLVSLVVVTSMMFLTACGKKTDNYVGYWQGKGGAIAEIKKDGSNYILTDKIVPNAVNGTPLKTLPLTEKDGKLAANMGLGDMPFALSDDNKTLYVANETYTKIDEAKKTETIEKAKKINAIQVKCDALQKEFADKWRAIPITFDTSYDGTKTALIQEYTNKYNEVDKEGQCVGKPSAIAKAQGKK